MTPSVIQQHYAVGVSYQQSVCGYESLLHARRYESRGGTTSLRVTLPLSFCDDFGGGAPRPHSRLICDPTYRSLSATYSVALPHDYGVLQPVSELYILNKGARLSNALSRPPPQYHTCSSCISQSLYCYNYHHP